MAGRGRITAAARKEGARVKAQRGLFNRYVRAVKSDGRARLLAELAEVEATLARGERLKKAAVFEGGRRVGTADKMLPLLPSEHAKLLVRRNTLQAEVAHVVSADLRAAFLEILPEYAARNGFTRAILLEVGVPGDDLDAVGLTD